MDDKIGESTNIKNIIQQEKEKNDDSFKNVIEQIEKFYKKMIDELTSKVNEVNNKLNYYFEKYNNEIELSKKISEEAKKYNFEEKNNLKLISYIYKLNKTCENIKNLMSEQLYSLKYSFDINNKEIIYEEPKINNFNKKYSYLCVNRSNLCSFITKGTPNTTIEITLINDGKKDWPSNTKLIFDDNSQIKADDIILNPQKCNEEQTYKINFNNLCKLNIGKYECFLWFNINDENLGDKINLKIKVNDNDILSMVETFRESFSISKDDYKDNRLIEVLKKADYDFELAFSYLFE